MLSESGSLLGGRRKVLALLAFLARHPGRPVRRERAADLLWGSTTSATARQSLRQALTELREVLGSALATDADAVILAPGAVALDLTLFEEDVRAGRPAAAARRWRGEFLTGLDDLGGEAWREWLERERAALARSGAGVLEELASGAESRGDWAEAVQYARQWRDLQPDDERAATVEERILRASGGAAPTRETRGLATPALTGREEELTRLEGAWSKARRAEARVVLVEGEPGQGTSRLLEEFARSVKRAGNATVIDARGYLTERSEPHGLTRMLLGRMARAPGLAAAPPGVLASLRVMAPELEERFPGPPAEPGRYPIPAAVHRALAEIAAEAPVLLVVDDAATTDAASLEVLTHLVRHPPAGCLVLMGGRPDAWAGVAGESDVRQGAGHIERIALAGLDEAQMEALIHSVAAFEPASAARLARQIRQEVGAAPGYAVEVLRQLVESGALAMDPSGCWRSTREWGPLPLPPGLAERTRARRARLGDAALQLLEAAAVLEDPMPARVIQAVANVSGTAADDGVAELLARRWLRAPASLPESLGFVAEASRRVVYGDLPADRRRQLHRAAAGSLVSAPMPEPARAASMARHRAASAVAPRGRRRRLVSGGLGLAAVAVLAVLIFRWSAPPPDGAVRVLLADVADLTPGSELRGALGTAAAIALRESERIQLFPRDQVRATLARMGRAGADSTLDLALAREVAERENLDAVMVIAVERTTGTYTVTGRLVEPATGETLAEAARGARSTEGVVATLDEVLTSLRRSAGESRRALATRRRLPFATTASIEALRAYADGRRAWLDRDSKVALVRWRRAVELDSGFAMALLAVSDWHYWNNDRVNGETYLRQALALTNRLTERERLTLEAVAAQRLGTPEEAAARLTVLAAAYPDRENWTNLASTLMRQGRCADAIPAARRALGFDTLYANAWITVATCFQLLDQADSALAGYAMAEAAQPGVLYRGSLNQEWGRAYIRTGNLTAAESVFTRMAAQDNPFDRPFGIRSLGLLAMLRGRYREAAGHFLEAAVQSRARDAKVSELRNRVLLAEAWLTAGDRPRATVALDRALELMQAQAMEPGYHLFLGHALARSGRVREARTLAVALRERVVATNPQDQSAQGLLEGWLELAEGRPDAALAAVTEDRYEPYAGYRHALRADAFARLGQADSALSAARMLAAGYHFGYDSEDEWLRGLLRVGRSAEAAGDPAEARRAYSAYLERWRDGDGDLPEVRWARDALSRLRDGS